MHPTVNIAVRAARKAGDIILRYHNQIDLLTIQNKSKNNFASEVDKLAESAIINEIKKTFAKSSILSEESGEILGTNNDRWIIDPLNGTNNYLHGFPQYCVSIAMYTKEQAQHAVIYDPFKEELFTASRGEGAYLNDNRIRASKIKDFDNSLIATGFPCKNPEKLDTYLEMFKEIHPQVSDIRRSGSAALDLAYLAAGRVDGFWEIGLNTWDIAAGALIIQEAGGFIGDFSGRDQYLQTGNIVAGNKDIFKYLLTAIHPHLGADLQR